MMVGVVTGIIGVAEQAPLELEVTRNLLRQFAPFELDPALHTLPVARNDSEIEILRVYGSVAHRHS